jgi:CheY-like chemotaxis protein
VERSQALQPGPIVTQTRRRIAVVEDNADNRLLLSCVLSDEYDLESVLGSGSTFTVTFQAG